MTPLSGPYQFAFNAVDGCASATPGTPYVTVTVAVAVLCAVLVNDTGRFAGVVPVPLTSIGYVELASPVGYAAPGKSAVPLNRP